MDWFSKTLSAAFIVVTLLYFAGHKLEWHWVKCDFDEFLGNQACYG